MSTPRLLDACCCAGAATHGYQRAGFHVTGVDIEPQPNYGGNEFVLGDAIAFIRDHGSEFDFIHASWPCQAYTPLNAYNQIEYPDLVEEGREVMLASGRPFVIENVPQAPLRNAVTLCGSMFGLRLIRHRSFEPGSGFALPTIACLPHSRCARNGYLPTPDLPWMTVTGGKHSEAWRLKANEVMGTPWMRTIREVCEAVPPLYTEWVGTQAIAMLRCAA